MPASANLYSARSGQRSGVILHLKQTGEAERNLGYLQPNLFAPLGMHSTSFKISPAQRARLASVHARGPDEALTVSPFEMPQEPQFQSGGAGLYSTAQDYLRFTQMLLRCGTFNGHQVFAARDRAYDGSEPH